MKVQNATIGQLKRQLQTVEDELFSLRESHCHLQTEHKSRESAFKNMKETVDHANDQLSFQHKDFLQKEHGMQA